MARKRRETRPDTATLLPLEAYDYYIVSFSGGKDSWACVANLLDLGVDPGRIQLWHQMIDGPVEEHEPNFMDWPVTESYCEAVAAALGVRFKGLKLLYQWKIDGFEGELLREDARTKGVCFECQAGEVKCVPPSKTGKIATRRKFPQVTADLSTRWCTAYLKIDVAARAINNDPDLSHAKILFMTGERREESAARSTYARVEKHRSCTKKRIVHHWRPILDWLEPQVWDAMKRWRITPHPCYYLGFSRCSCIACIFSQPDQWATVREIAPDMFDRIADYEQEFGYTIHRTRSVVEQADRGEPYPEIFEEGEALKLAMSRSYPPAKAVSKRWRLPGGAGRESGGPT